MSGFDLTVAITAHAETVVSGPTMRSAEAAIAAAEAAGARVQRLLGLDNCTEGSRAYFRRPEFAGWEPHEFAFRDQGRSRNALAEAAAGEALAFLDGDDLFSENWLVEALKLLDQAEKDGARIIVHPELNWVFDGGAFVMTLPGQSDPLFAPYYMGIANYYDALCAAPRRAWLERPYAERAVARGFAYEDWQWAIETMAAGWTHVAAPDTIIFKRRRDMSQFVESRSNLVTIREIEATGIDRIPLLGGGER
ncbi:MAG: glycosyltransferase [Pikeienuella sp.]